MWYQWTAPLSGLVTFDTFGSNFDTLLGVYTGNVVRCCHGSGQQRQCRLLDPESRHFRRQTEHDLFIAVDGKSIGVEQGTGLPRSQSGLHPAELEQPATASQ